MSRIKTFANVTSNIMTEEKVVETTELNQDTRKKEEVTVEAGDLKATVETGEVEETPAEDVVEE